MATRIALKHKEAGIMKDGFYGFSWTTLFFGFFPALFRSDFITFIGGFVIFVIIALLTYGIGAFLISFVWAFMYNKYYTRKLLERGYVFAESDGDNALAASALGDVASSADSRKCPFCAELVKTEASICKHCHKDLPEFKPEPVRRYVKPDPW